MIKHAEPPRGLRRVGVAALVVAAGLAAGAVLVLAGFVGGGLCDAEGFACLGWLFAGLFAGCGAAAIVILLAARRLGLGWSFGFVTLGVASLALLPLQEEARVAIVTLAPVIALALTWPRRAEPTGHVSTSHRHHLRWGGLLVTLGVLTALIGGSMVTKERSLLASRTAEYEGTGVPVIGLADGTSWRYDTVIALGGPGQEKPQVISSYLIDGKGAQIALQTKLSEDSSAQPPGNCSTDPYRDVPCSETVPGVYETPGQANQRLVAFDSVVARVTVLDGTVTDAELDAFCASLERRDARWLATQQSWLYRLLA